MQSKPLETILFQDKRLWVNGQEITQDVFIDLTGTSTNLPKTIRDAEFTEMPVSDPPTLGINVSDAVKSKDIGPGQR